MSDDIIENETFDLDLPAEDHVEEVAEDESSLENLIPYAYAKKNNILVEMTEQGDALVTCSDMPKVVVLSELKRRLNCKLSLNKIAAPEFDQRLRDAYDNGCLLYTSPSPRDQRGSRMPSSA